MIDKILLVSKDKNVIDKLKSQKYESETTYTSVKEEFSYLNEFPKYKYDNLKIITKNNEVAIIGSLRKYMAKHSDRNILYYNPTISDFYDFCDKVESDLGIDISKMKVYQLEMGITAKVKNPVVDYLDSMFYLPDAKKNVFGDNSKRFNLSTKNEPYKASSFQFYDNAKLYNNNEENIIRMELAIPKRLKRKLKFNDAIIFEEFLYDNVWEDIYEQFITAIKTKRIPTTIDNLLIGSPKELIYYLTDVFFSNEDNYDLIEGLLSESALSNYDLNQVGLKQLMTHVKYPQHNQTKSSDLKNELINIVTENFNNLN